MGDPSRNGAADSVSSPDSASASVPPSDDSARFLHDATLTFQYDSRARARAIARSVAREVGEIDGDRSEATVERDDQTLVVRVVAADLVALRAGCNTWGSLVEVAERVTGLA